MISVVTITYNNFEELKKTLDSIEGLDGIQSVIINGGTCLKTQKYLENHIGIVINEKDLGISDAFNKGITYSSGESITFLNSGDFLRDKSYYQKVSDLFIKEKSIDFAHSSILFADSLLGPIEFKFEGKSLGRGMPFYHQTMVVRKRVFEKVGTFSLDKKIGMDYDFVVRLYKYNMKGFYFPEVSVEMDGRGISSRDEDDSIKECYYSLQEHRMLNFRNLRGIIIRYTLYKIRMLIHFFGGDKMLILAKSLKRKL